MGSKIKQYEELRGALREGLAMAVPVLHYYGLYAIDTEAVVTKRGTTFRNFYLGDQYPGG